MEEWSDPERVAEYLSREIPHRQTAEAMLLQALPERVDRFLDPADRLADPHDQLEWLRAAGFADADCLFKWLQLTLVVGSA